ncbi:hypothetical protein D9611_014196 [Ephemerocybe angulata]|uniref:Uncharacterized protein n=1 Tax=Ephemerocybe angulata TaxID=980116 RepID=A0A8H5CA91_9AGAR|nr:hypothetical protein D9611_014196 [Tulosesus angulatus]
MGSTLPLELIYLCIKASSDSFAALRQLSLVSKECVSETRKYIFKDVKLDRRGRDVDLYSHRIRTFLDLLSANGGLASYIRSLLVKLEPSTYAATEAYTHDLPAILDLLTDLMTLQLNSATTLSNHGADWDTLPDQLRLSITRRCSALSITNLAFADLKNFPQTLLPSASRLTHLSLLRVRGPAGAQSVSTTQDVVGRLAQPLESFSVNDSTWIAANCIFANPGPIPSLRKLTWTISDQRDLDTLLYVLRKCGASLKELDLSFQLPPDAFANPGLNHMINALHIGAGMVELPQLQLMSLSSETLLGEIDFDTTAGLGSHLRLFVAILRTQRLLPVLRLNIKLWNPEFMTGTRASEILRDRADWKALDAHLSSEHPAPLFTKLYFNDIWLGAGSISTLSPSQAEKKDAFNQQLRQETYELLSESYRANKLTVFMEEFALPRSGVNPQP